MIDKIKKLFGLGGVRPEIACLVMRISRDLSTCRRWIIEGRIYRILKNGTSKKLSLDSKVYPGDKIFLRKSNGVRNIKTVK